LSRRAVHPYESDRRDGCATGIERANALRTAIQENRRDERRNDWTKASIADLALHALSGENPTPNAVAPDMRKP